MPGMGFGFGFGFHRRASGSGASASEQLLTLATAAGAEAVYDPDNEDTWTLRDDGSDLWYSTISDGLGNREDWTSVNAAEQPKQITLSTGRRAMLSPTTSRMRADFAASIAQPNTVLLVCRSTDSSKRAWVIDSNNATGADRQIVAANGSGAAAGWEMFAGSWLGGDVAADNNWVFVHANYNGASSELILDGVSASTGDAGTGALDGLFLPSEAKAVSTEVGAILVFTGLKTNAEISDILDHINANWPIGLAA